MAASDYLSGYAAGWSNGDLQVILGSLADGYEMDDPNSGLITKAAFSEYFAGFKAQVDSMRGPTTAALMELSELVTKEEGGVLTAWAWWAVPGTPIQGSGLIKVGDNGVLSERLTFYTKLPEA